MQSRLKLSARDRVPDRSSYHGLSLELSENDRNAYIACGKALKYLTKVESHGACGLEKSSVYGAAVAIPQIARSSGWSATLTASSILSYFFLLLNISLQVYLLTVVAEAEILGSAFAGKMHLCDMGAKLEACPGRTNCQGPGGTSFSPPRLYSFSVWQTRNFVRDSLIAIFPDRKEDIEKLVDVGEYGMENYYCRGVCCFLFMMSMTDDLFQTVNLAGLLYYVPSDNSKWVRYDLPRTDSEQAKSVFGLTEFHLVRFGISGMPFRWKVATAIFVFVPKAVMWWILATLGVHVLMETAGIVDVIMNSLTLTFIIQLDEMIFAILTTVQVKYMMGNLEEHALFDMQDDEHLTDEEVLQDYLAHEFGSTGRRACLKTLVPKRLLAVVVLMVVFMYNYYRLNCDFLEDGSAVSKPMSFPQIVRFNPLFFFTNSYPMDAEPYWSMPSATSR
mmetsp:Transcript_35898/g.102092  ORF Transcript_35898/g.102092 Transcript_35898/m.102092 type:complete len:446 (+) Transcript_35898:83-1420(+)